MPEHIHYSAMPSHPTPTKRRFKLRDLLIPLILVILIAALALTLSKQLALRNEANAATAASDKLIAAMQRQDGAAARKLGDKSFQAQHSAQELTGLFNQSKPYTSGSPEVVKRTVTNGTANKVVSVYYKFSGQKPFYVRTTVLQPNSGGDWRLINFSGNASLSELTK